MTTFEYQPGKKDLFVLVGVDSLQPFQPGFSFAGLLRVSGFDWENMCSPWPAKRVWKGGKDFGGHAEELAQEITETLQSITEPYEHTYLIGYSLAGLFALWYCSQSSNFTGCASCSGSLWYPSWMEYFYEHPLQVEKVYFSLGDLEKNSRNPIFASVEEKTNETFQFAKQDHQAIFELVEGNHFQNPERRILRAMQWLKK